MFRKIITGMAFLGIIYTCSFCHPDSGEKEGRDLNLTKVCDKNFTDAAAQYKLLKSGLSENRFPKTFQNGELETSGSAWWCSGFYPGTLLYLYQQTGDKELYNEAVRTLEYLKREQFNTSTHDLGFMMYCSFGNAYKIDPKEQYKQILINSARSLSSRFDPTVGCIRSWDSGEKDFIVIIDNMMNLELLFWATQETGDSSYYDIAVKHANTTMKNHFRSDHSSYHLLNYNPETGEVKERITAQGYSDESAWARGQMWGLYGYTVMYRFTKDKKYLKQAQNIADFVLEHPNMPEDKISYWDFNSPDIPNAKRDVSAAAVLASALLELKGYVNGDGKEEYLNAAEKIIATLSTDKYKAPLGSNGGFLLKHGVGHIPQGTEVDVPLTYADYYFVEAMKRYIGDLEDMNS